MIDDKNGRKERKVAATHIRVCEICGSEFKSSYRKAKFCSSLTGQDCQEEGARRRQYAWQGKPPPEERTVACPTCGAVFVTRYGKKLYCSNECQVKGYKTKVAENGLGTGWLKARFMVLARDHFRCRYCGNGPKQGRKLHVDHVTPHRRTEIRLSKLVTACSECNIGKGDVLVSAHRQRGIQLGLPEL